LRKDKRDLGAEGGGGGGGGGGGEAAVRVGWSGSESLDLARLGGRRNADVGVSTMFERC